MGDRLWPDIDVGQRCHIQRPAKRFGVHAIKEIKEYVLALPPNNAPPSDDDFDDFLDVADEEDSQSDEEPVMPEAATTVAAAVGVASVPLMGMSSLEISHDTEGHASVNPSNGFPQVPRVARTRSNLTALSQRYNLYFAAYQNKVYVYQPQRAPQILPTVSLILSPPESRMAKLTGGVQDRRFPHQMNYVIVGELGNLEVLLLAFDDGDVVAYYTHHIVQAIERRMSSMGLSVKGVNSQPSPFFHESVGASAWGLAIHAHSRLIAVSSNRHDVTVFAFALRSKEKRMSEHVQAEPELWSGKGVLDLERHFRSRTRTWRIVLATGHDGRNSPHNIPSITFCDDDAGNADKVVAVDINGNTWLLDIWNVGSHATATLIRQTSKAGMAGMAGFQDQGWSVLVLPNNSFRPAMSNHAAMGLPPTQMVGLNLSTGEGIKNYMWLDITASLRYVKDMAADPDLYLRQRHGSRYHSGGTAHTWQSISYPALGITAAGIFGITAIPLVDEDDDDDDDDDDEGEEEEDSVPVPSVVPGPTPLGIRAEVKTDTFDPAQEHELGFELGLTIVPAMAKVCQPSTSRQLRDFVQLSGVREQATHVVDLCHERLPSYLSQHFSIMKATTSSVELQSLDPKSASVLCYDVLPHHNHHRRHPTPWDLSARMSERISMYHHIPELGLVVLGSLSGRVALLSLTRPPDRHSFNSRAVGGGPVLGPGPGSPSPSLHRGGGGGGSGGGRGASGREGVLIRRAFRVEAVLPRKSDEDRHLRPWCTLHGVAVSPVPDHDAGAGLALRAPGAGWRPRAWRLILHYIDHTILMYDISRHKEEGDLLII